MIIYPKPFDLYQYNSIFTDTIWSLPISFDLYQCHCIFTNTIWYLLRDNKYLPRDNYPLPRFDNSLPFSFNHHQKTITRYHNHFIFSKGRLPFTKAIYGFDLLLLSWVYENNPNKINWHLLKYLYNLTCLYSIYHRLKPDQPSIYNILQRPHNP